jgi:chromosomal replication initiation ATPase DnaA
MKKKIFLEYLDAVCSVYGITKEDVLSNNKKKELSEARQCLYYLCRMRPMRVTDIQKYISEVSDYVPSHVPILRGVNRVKQLLEEDRDVAIILERIKNKVFI